MSLKAPPTCNNNGVFSRIMFDIFTNYVRNARESNAFTRLCLSVNKEMHCDRQEGGPVLLVSSTSWQGGLPHSSGKDQAGRRLSLSDRKYQVRKKLPLFDMKYELFLLVGRTST